MRDFELFAQRLGLVGITNFLTGLSGVFLLPILAKNLSIDDYGIWAQVNVTLVLVSTVMLLGLPNSMIRFMASMKDEDAIKNGFYSILICAFISALLSAVIAYLFSRPLSNLLFNGNSNIFDLLPLVIFIDPINNTLFNYFRTYQKTKLHSFFSILNSYMAILFIAYFIISGYGIYGAILGFLTNKIALFLIMLGVIISQIGIKVPDFRDIRPYLAFGLPIVPGNLAIWVITSSDRYLISILLGTAYVGYYSPGYVLGNMISLFSAPLSFLLPSALAAYYDAGNLNQVKMVMSFSLKYFLAIAIPSTFGLSLLSRPILEVLSTPEIAANGYLVTPLVAISSLMLGVFYVISNIIILEKRTVLSSNIWLAAALLGLVLNLVLIPRLNILGAALTVLIAFSFVVFTTNYYSIKYLRFNIDYIFILKSIIASIVMSLSITMLIPVGSLQVLLTIAIGAAVYLVALLLLKGFSRREFRFFADMLIRKA